MVTHDVSLKFLAHRVVHMMDGKIHRIERISPKERSEAIEAIRRSAEVCCVLPSSQFCIWPHPNSHHCDHSLLADPIHRPKDCRFVCLIAHFFFSQPVHSTTPLEEILIFGYSRGQTLAPRARNLPPNMSCCQHSVDWAHSCRTVSFPPSPGGLFWPWRLDFVVQARRVCPPMAVPMKQLGCVIRFVC